MDLPSYLIDTNMMEKQAADGNQSSNSHTIIFYSASSVRDGATFSFNQRRKSRKAPPPAGHLHASLHATCL